MPFRADNALVTAAEIVRRLAEYQPRARLDELWAARVDATGLPPETKAGLLDPARLDDTLAELPVGQAKLYHACTHTTFSPNVLHGGVKTNVIPDRVEIDVDIRTLPGVTGDEVDANLREALGDLADRVEVSRIFDDESSASPTRTPMWDILERRTRVVYPDADLLPELIVGATDSRFFREKGTVAYGTGLFSPGVSFSSSPPASTATTSASTSSRSGCAPTCGWAWWRTCWHDRTAGVTPEQADALADRFFGAVERGDLDELRRLLPSRRPHLAQLRPGRPDGRGEPAHPDLDGAAASSTGPTRSPAGSRCPTASSSSTCCGASPDAASRSPCRPA